MCRWLRTCTRMRTTSSTAPCCPAGRGPHTPSCTPANTQTTGLNVQVACTLTGDLAWISDPINGSRHDTYCLNESGVVADEPSNWIGDKGYVGNDMLTPIKKPDHRNLVDWEKEFNKQIDNIRHIIE